MKYSIIFGCLSILAACGMTLHAEERNNGLEPYRDWFGEYGYVDSSGNIVIGCQFDDARNFSEGLAAVLSRSGGVAGAGVFGSLSPTLKWGYIDTTGLIVIPCQFDYAGEFREGYAAVMSGNKWGFIDRRGDTLADYRYDEVRGFVNGYAAVCKGGLWGYLDAEGNELVPCSYSVAADFGSDGFAAVSTGDSTGFVFRDGQWYATKDRALNWIRGIPFSVYAKDKVMNRINEWQLQEPGEMLQDWEVRVNDESFAARLEGLEMRYEAEYVSANRLEDPELVPGQYDSIGGMLPVDIHDRAGDRHFSIMLSVAPEDVGPVLDGWKRIKADFRYFIKDDHVSIASVEIVLPGNRTYSWEDPDYGTGRTAQLDYDLEDLDFTLPGKIYRRMAAVSEDTLRVPDSDVDIPSGNRRDGSHIYAVIIANQDYGAGVAVPYALNDGAVFREYCLSRLCVPEDQIAYLTNAGAEDFISLYGWLDRVSRMFDADTRILLYFSGQCILDKGLGETFLLPVDYRSKGVQSGLGLRNFYGRISRWGVDDALLLLDATYGKICRNGMMLNVFKDGETRPEWLRPNDRIVTVFAAGEDGAALPYPGERHGIFTYFVLKALQQHPDGISYGDLFDFVSSGVRRVASELYGVGQSPLVYSSEWDGGAWREFYL